MPAVVEEACRVGGAESEAELRLFEHEVTAGGDASFLRESRTRACRRCP